MWIRTALSVIGFGLTRLLDFDLLARIKRINHLRFYLPATTDRASYPNLAPALVQRGIDWDLIGSQYDDMMKYAASIKNKTAATAAILRRFHRAGCIPPIRPCRRSAGRSGPSSPAYLVDETYRRRIGRQLNKGENVHALKRMLAYAGEGAIRRPHHEQQAEQMWCLTLATNAVVTWTTEYNGLAVTVLRRSGRDIDDAVLAHI